LSYDILHHGARDGVTGSCHELRLASGSGLLVDCGLFQGAEVSPGGAGAEQLRIEFPIDHLLGLVVTHVHIDHVGRIPYLLAAGFQRPIYCSEPSAELLPLVIEDALRVGVTRDRDLIGRVLGLLERLIVPLPYGRWRRVDTRSGESLEVRLQRAGHILGSAYVECRVDRGVDRRRVVFSGDLGALWTPLLPAPRSPTGCDLLVLESTYGDRNHVGRRERRQVLQAAVEHALADGGTVLIPAFSIGRTQELLYELEDIIHRNRGRRVGQGSWDELDIVLDSPLAARFTDVYERLRRYWDAEARYRAARGRHPLSFAQLVTVDSHDDHLRLVRHLAESRRPAVVIAAGGMCAGGRIVNYLKAMLGDRRHDVLFVGYQARGTPGRDIQTYGPSGGWVLLDGERHEIRAQVRTISGYSAHADQNDLARFALGMRCRPRHVRLVHGDPQARQGLAERLGSAGLETSL
jgi:metallo-beta-lactamase family protein